MNALRLAAVRDALARRRLDGVVLRAPEHVWWLTGAGPVAGAVVVVGPAGAVAATDSGAPGDLADAVRDLGLAGRPIGTDSGDVPASLATVAGSLLDARSALADARRDKDPGELRALEHAAAVVDAAMAAAGDAAVAGATDHEVFDAAETALADHAGPGAVLEGNVGAAWLSADPDAVPSGVALREQDWLFVDLYPRVGWYYGDASRAFSVGAPTRQARELHAALWEALEHSAAALAPGVSGGEIDARCRAVLARHDMEQHFPHHTGHGLGLFQQEPPMLVAGGEDVLRPGDVVTIEPGAYVPGVGGMRVEDAFVIEERGARRLTRASRELSRRGIDG